MNTQLDDHFREIPSLNWLPWVGSEYLNLEQSKRLLILGESHYHDSEVSKEWHESKVLTRDVVLSLGIENPKTEVKLFRNMHRALFGNNYFDSNRVWNSVSFYNFIQRALGKKMRPTKNDFITAWHSLFEVLKLVQPQTCLFLGVSAANYLSEACIGQNYTCKIGYGESGARVRPRIATLTNAQGEETRLIFIQHCSSYFSWLKWNEFLNREMPEQLDYLGKLGSK